MTVYFNTCNIVTYLVGLRFVNGGPNGSNIVSVVKGPAESETLAVVPKMPPS